MHISLRLVFSNTPKRLLLQFAPRIREAGSGDIFKSGPRTHSFSCSLWSLLTSTSWEKPDPLPVLLVAVSPVKEMIHCFRMIHTQHLVSLTLFTCVLCLCERVISVCVCVFSHAILFIFFYMWYCVFLFLQTCELARRLSEGDVHFEWTEAETIVLNRLPVNGVCACRRQ